MITKLRIRSFKSLEDSDVIEFKPLTIFTGILWLEAGPERKSCVRRRK